jgi:hypothetical protein
MQSIVLYCDVRVYTLLLCVHRVHGCTVAGSILLTNSAPAFLEYGKNIHTLIAIDAMQGCMLHICLLDRSLSLCCLHSAIAMHCLWRGGFLSANCTSTLLCLSRAHRNRIEYCWTSLVKTLGKARNCHRSGQVWSYWSHGSGEASYCQASAILIMAIPSLNTPSQPASVREQQWTPMK